MTDAAAFAEGGTDPEPADPAHIVLDFSRGKDMATPAFPYHDKDDSSSATEGTYTIDGYTYYIKASADGKFYWFYNNYNAETKPETVYEAFFIGTTGRLHRTARHQRQGALEGHPDRRQRCFGRQRSRDHGHGRRRHRRRPVASSRQGRSNLRPERHGSQHLLPHHRHEEKLPVRQDRTLLRRGRRQHARAAHAERQSDLAVVRGRRIRPRRSPAPWPTPTVTR